MTDLEKELLECLVDVIYQSCSVMDKDGKVGTGLVESQYISAYEHALDLLERLGYARKTDKGHQLVWPDWFGPVDGTTS